MIKRAPIGATFIFFVFVITMCVFATTQISRAATVPLFAPEPGTGAVQPTKMVKDFYDLAIMASGILAFGMIVFGAILYTVSAGNPSKQSDARDRIWQALLGLLLLFGAYFILNIINPRLTTLKIGAPTSMAPNSHLAHVSNITPIA